jgi:hypothetical protein
MKLGKAARKVATCGCSNTMATKSVSMKLRYATPTVAPCGPSSTRSALLNCSTPALDMA